MIYVSVSPNMVYSSKNIVDTSQWCESMRFEYSSHDDALDKRGLHSLDTCTLNKPPGRSSYPSSQFLLLFPFFPSFPPHPIILLFAHPFFLTQSKPRSHPFSPPQKEINHNRNLQLIPNYGQPTSRLTRCKILTIRHPRLPRRIRIHREEISGVSVGDY